MRHLDFEPEPTRRERAGDRRTGFSDSLLGLLTSLDPQWLFRLADMEPLRYPDVFACVGMIVGLYGVVYLEVARRPETGFVLAAVGLIGKILGGCRRTMFEGSSSGSCRVGFRLKSIVFDDTSTLSRNRHGASEPATAGQGFPTAS